MTGVGQKLRELRLKRGLSQTKLAQKVGVSQTFISALEMGLKQPSLKTLLALADALSVSPDELLHVAAEEVPHDS
ncbi:helix-turn-helix domain-containing protein [Thermus tengchongensis]|uniref:helix-turn-helix domain-containing protein n=1 Tax=Thermus tengchongensis TaxID=1214928 RepID=UPI003642F08D